MSVLDFSKQHMHKLNNGVMKPKYADNTRMVYTDTDIQIDLKDILRINKYKALARMKQQAN